MDVKRFRLVNGLAVKDIVAVMRREYPKYSKMVHSMVENPQRYGVKLLPEAERLMTEELTGGRGSDRHRNKYKLMCRVTKTRYDAVKQAVALDGRFPTVQAWLDWWVYVWLQKHKKAAPGGNDTRDGGRDK